MPKENKACKKVLRSSANVLNKRACLAMCKVKQGQRENRLQGFDSVSAPCARQ